MNLTCRRQRLAMIFSGLLLAILVNSSIATAASLATEQRAAVINKAASLSIPFLENQGRLTSNVAFTASTLSGTVLVSKDGTITYVVPAFPNGQAIGGPIIAEQLVSDSATSVAGALPYPVGLTAFNGNNPTAWQEVRTPYRNVSMGDIKQGVSLQLAAFGNRVEKQIRIKPGVSPDIIRFAVAGGTLALDAGALTISAGSSILTFDQPIAYQEDTSGKIYISISFNSKGSDYGFTLGTYDTSRELTIVSKLAMLPVSVMEAGTTVAIDATGNSFLSVPVASSGVLIAKTGSSVVDIAAMSFIGGSGSEVVKALAVDAAGFLYGAGTTASADFPITAGAFDTSYNGVSDAFVFKLSNNLSHLSASTYLGGTDSDAATSLDINEAGTVTVSGITYSADFPIQTGGSDTATTGLPQFFTVEFDSGLGSNVTSSFAGPVAPATADPPTVSTESAGTATDSTTTDPVISTSPASIVGEAVPAETSGVAGPGWFMITLPPITPEEAKIKFDSLQGQTASVKTFQGTGSGFTLMSATTATNEISELARALRNDPKLIYDYVHNNIDYVPYFGSLKGATLTMLDGSGNDFDQASLMIALLRASGFTAQYVYGTMTIPGRQADGSGMANWLGVDQNGTVIGRVIASGGIPCDTSQSNGTTRLNRVWVKARIGGTDYLFDPAFKSYTYSAKIDFPTAIGYNRTDFLSGATNGATIGTDYVKSLNEGNIRSKLTAYANNLVTNIRNQHANKSVEEIVGGRSIIQSNLIQYSTTLPFSPSVTYTWDDVPAAQTATIRIQHEGIDCTVNTSDLSGKRLTLSYPGTIPTLLLDGSTIPVSSSCLKPSGNTTTTGNKYSCSVSINHKYPTGGGGGADQSVTSTLESGRNYAIVYNFGGVSDILLQKRQQQLDRYKAQGLADTTEAVLGETLHLMGMTWLKEVSQSDQLLGAITETTLITHHKVGFMSQEAGYYIDVRAQIITNVSRHNIDADKDSYFKFINLIESAFEHGILEQLSGSDKPGLSTMKLFQIANAKSTNNKVFYLTSTNFNSVTPQLVNYPASEINDNDPNTNTDFRTMVDQGYSLILPQDGRLSLGPNQWSGEGYIRKKTNYMGTAIGGGYYGGYAATQETISTPTVSQNTLMAQMANFSPSTMGLNISTVQPSTSIDPVDMAGGAFLVDHTDLALGSAAPLGLAFSRSYTSADAMSKRSMGYGWGHNYDIYLTPASHGEPGLGLRQPVDAAAMIAAFFVGADLLKNNDDITAWVTSSLVSKWAIDQVIDNAMVVHIGKKVMEFIKLADGSYASPPGITTQLIKNGDGTFSLVERFGSRINFNGNKQASQIIDADGNTLTLTYSGTTLNTITDEYGRTLTLGYDTSSRVNRVTDSTGRFVTYGYTNNELTSYTDPEQKIWGYGYEPTGSHRLTTLTNPLTITTATNVYDSLGRVQSQTVPRQMQVDESTTATYNFYFSGFRNSEVDPSGNATTYYYDRKGREFAVENALGEKSSRQFDGQNHPVLVTDPRLNKTGYLYDGNQNLKETTNAVDVLNYKTTYQYDTSLRLSDILDPVQHNTHYGYDTKHHLNLTRDNLQNTTEATFNGPKGLKDTATDGCSTQSVFTYDGYGNPQSSKTAWYPSVTYVYDPIGRMTDLTDNVGSKTSFAYDKRNLITTITDPGRIHTTGFTYYDDGSLRTKTDRNGTVVTYTYTPSGKIESVSAPGWPNVTYAYNLLDQVTAMHDGIGSTTFDSYDAAGRLTSSTNPFDFTIGYLYDAAGNLTELTYPGNKKIIYTYDALNRLKTVKIDWLSGKPVATYTYKPQEPELLDNIVTFNGITTTYTFDGAHRLTGISSPVSSYSFTELDGNGNRKRVTQSEPLDTVPPPVTSGLNYNSSRNRLLSAGGNSFGYDNEGQLSSGFGSSYTFDYEHRLTAISGVASYNYDGAGNRLQASRGGVITRYIYDARGNLLAEADSSNNITRYYIHGAGLLAMVTPANQVYSYHYNATGSTVAMTNSSQAMVNKYAYDPFGNIVNKQETIPQPFTYVGQYGVMAEPNGFYYMKARYYDPAVGRFVSEDPLGFGGGDVNLMAYVQNNPVNGIDPLGLWTISGSVNLSGTLATVGATGGTNINIGHDPNSGLLKGWSLSITGTAGGGASIGFGGGLGFNATVTNAVNVRQLEGTSSEIGVGYGPVSIGRVSGSDYAGVSVSITPSLWRTPTGAVPGYAMQTSTSAIIRSGK